MNFYDNTPSCLECYTDIDRDIDTHSKRYFGTSLCVGCQQRLKGSIGNTTTNKTPDASFSLKKEWSGHVLKIQ